MAELYLGTARARLGPAAAFIDVERGAVAACEENRLTRAVDSGAAGPPELSIAELLRFLGRDRKDVVHSAGVSVSEPYSRSQKAARPAETRSGPIIIEPHLAHAAYARCASGFERPLVVVCGTDTSTWLGSTRIPVPAASTITAQYGELTARLGFRPTRDEHLVEALARGGHAEASATQQRLGEELLTMIAALKAQTNACEVCLSGGLFFNTYFTTRVASSGLFDSVYVPPHPGRNGAALGAAILAAQGAHDVTGAIGSPYLGPAYTDQEIKNTLENCKLSFDLVHDERLFELVLHQLSRGRLVGWYHGRLEWGPRALGHRTVLADPFTPHVLENLNGFLKRRPAFRAYGVSVPASRLLDFFDPAFSVSSGGARWSGSTDSCPSPFMQYEYRPRDLDKFHTILPPGVTTLRVHSVDESAPRYLRLLDLWGEKTGTPVLVNTSFNGFHEPLVCSPRDAIRVFYGTGIDVLALENFLLRK